MPAASKIQSVFGEAKNQILSRPNVLVEGKKELLEYLERMSAERASRHRSFSFDDGLKAELVFVPISYGQVVERDGDDETLKTRILGQVVGYLARPDGQVMTLNFGDTDLLDLNDFLKEKPEKINQRYQLMKDGDIGVNAFAEGVPVNSFFHPHNVHRWENDYIAGSSRKDNRQWVPLSIPDDPRYFGSFQVNASDDFNRYDAVRVIAEKIRDGKDLTIDFSRLHDRLLFDLSGMQDSYSEIQQALIDASEEDKLAAMPAAYAAASEIANQRLKEAGILIKESELNNYPLPAINFVVSGETNDIRRYRKEFVDTCYRLMHPDPSYIEKVNLASPRMHPFQATQNIVRLLEGNESGWSYTADRLANRMKDKIDVGHFPAKEIAEIAGIPNISKKQFARALEILGNSEEVKAVAVGGGYIPGVRDFESLSPEQSFAFARLPVEWWRWDDDHPDLLTGHTICKVGSNEFGKRFKHLFKPLVNTAKKMDAYQKDKNKSGLKALASQWRWLSHAGDTMGNKLLEFDEKYKLSSSFNDYPTLLNQMLETVAFRVVLDAPLNNMNEIFDPDIDDGSLTINESELHNSLQSILVDEYERELYNIPDDWDEEADGPYEPAPIHEDIDSVEMPSSMDILSRLNNHEFSLKRMAELNHKLHIDYTRIIRQCNEGSPHQITWEPLTEAPIELGDSLVATTIDNRLDLLEEGQAMDHCVFSYLNRCLNGESIILSVKDKNTNERVATIELEVDDPDEETLSLSQCFGYGNSSGESVSLAENLMEEWLEQVNEKRIPTRLGEILSSDTASNDELEKVLDNPSEEGSLLCTIPYDGDGAYLAAFLFEKYSPPGISVEDIFESNQGLMELYYRSSLSGDLRKLREIASKWGVKPEKVVEYKMRHSVHFIDDLEPHKERQRALLSQWNTLWQQNTGVLPVSDIVAGCEKMLSEFNGEVFADTDAVVAELEKERPDWHAVWQQSSKPKPSPDMSIAPEVHLPENDVDIHRRRTIG